MTKMSENIHAKMTKMSKNDVNMHNVKIRQILEKRKKRNVEISEKESTPTLTIYVENASLACGD